MRTAYSIDGCVAGGHAQLAVLQRGSGARNLQLGALASLEGGHADVDVRYILHVFATLAMIVYKQQQSRCRVAGLPSHST